MGVGEAGMWIKCPLAILAEGAEEGVVVSGGRIVELVAAGQMPRTPYTESFDASRHVVIPGLVNTHHHMFQTLTRAHPAAINKPLWPWIQALYPGLGAQHEPRRFPYRLAARHRPRS